MASKRIDLLESSVRSLYESKNPSRADWSDWLYENHVFLVANKAEELAVRFGADPELARAAGMLHDIADSVMSRFDSGHENKSKQIAKSLLKKSEFNEDEIETVVEDAIAFHGCKNGNIPKTPEGKVMATADAVVHLTTDFYKFGLTMSDVNSRNKQEAREWAQKKIERDYREKILFADVQKEVEADYKTCKDLADRLLI